MECGSNNFLGITTRLVGARRFELLTPCAQGRCATRLRYAPTCEALLILNYLRVEHPSRNSLSAQKRIKTVSKPFASLACRLIFSQASQSDGGSSRSTRK